MTNLDITQLRLYNQHVSHQIFKKPGEIVKWLGAVQAQDYAGAKWALGLRLQEMTDAAIDEALANGSIIRTHVLRPTWHFVSPDDARWMIELTAPRINALGAVAFRQVQLDDAIFRRSNDALAKALEGGKRLERDAMKAVLQAAGVITDDIRFIHLLMRAELDKVICSGGRQGKQFTYALFDDRVPMSGPLVCEEALSKLARQYFISRGPATLRDFTWWSGLSGVDARLGLEIVKPELSKITVEGIEYWMAVDNQPVTDRSSTAYLLPAFDEYAVAYKDRTAIVNPLYLKQARYVIFDPVMVVNNQVAGTWKRAMKKNAIDITLSPFGKLTKAQAKAIETAAGRYRKFINP